jgi:hypothetical protein
MREQVNIIVIYVPWFWYVIATILNEGCQCSHSSECDGCQGKQGFNQSQSDSILQTGNVLSLLLWYMKVCNEMKHGGHCRDVISG